jgi:hypothetical protein
VSCEHAPWLGRSRGCGSSSDGEVYPEDGGCLAAGQVESEFVDRRSAQGLPDGGGAVVDDVADVGVQGGEVESGQVLRLIVES